MKGKPHPMLTGLALALCALALAGCSTPGTRIRDNPAAFARLSPDQQALVRAGQIALGFDMAAVRLALGAPYRITIHTDAAGQTQTWHYVEPDTNERPVIVYDGGHPGRVWRGSIWWGPPWGEPFFGPYPPGVRDVLRVLFDRAGKVVSIQQDLPP